MKDWQFKKGNPGKPMGAKSKKIKAWEALGEFFTKAGAERVKEILNKSDDKQFILYYEKLLEYFKPKLNRTDITSGDKPINELPFNITINHRDS
jgi:hypothetical protein